MDSTRALALPVVQQPRLMGMGDPRDQDSLISTEFDSDYDATHIATRSLLHLDHTIAPADARLHPSAYWYPRATEHSARRIDMRYKMEHSRTFRVPTGDKDDRKKLITRTAVHEAFSPPPFLDVDNRLVYPSELRVPGQRQMTPGVPEIVSDPSRPMFEQTFAVLHLPSTLRSIPGNEDLVNTHIPELIRVTFGDSRASGVFDRNGIFDYDMTPNLRDPGHHHSSHEGSFSLAFTSGEGEGLGNVQPAKQVRAGPAGDKIKLVLPLLARLGKCALKASMRRLEYETNRARGILNNVPGFGDAENVFFTGVQLNVSGMRSKDLSQAIGSLQGLIHADIHDCAILLTVAIMILRMPFGSDPGAFMFPEYGLFAHTVEHVFDDFYVCILVFKGRHAHGGMAPRTTYSQGVLDDICEKTKAINRCVYVLYANHPAVGRVGTFSIGLPTGFWTSSLIGQRKATARTMVDEAVHVFVDHVLFSDWNSREIAFCTYNSLLMMANKHGHAGDHITLVHYLQHAVLPADGVGGRAVHRPIPRIEFDPSVNPLLVQQFRRLFAGLSEIADHFLIPLRKADMRKGQLDALTETRLLLAPPVVSIVRDAKKPLEGLDRNLGRWFLKGVAYEDASRSWIGAIHYEHDTDTDGVHWVPEHLLLKRCDSAQKERLEVLKAGASLARPIVGSSQLVLADQLQAKRKWAELDLETRNQRRRRGSPPVGHPTLVQTPSPDTTDDELMVEELVEEHNADHDADSDVAPMDVDGSALPLPPSHPAVVLLAKALRSSSIQTHIDALQAIRERGSLRQNTSRNTDKSPPSIVAHSRSDTQDQYTEYDRLFRERDDTDDMPVRCMSLVAALGQPLPSIAGSHRNAQSTEQMAFAHACRFFSITHAWFSRDGPRLGQLLFDSLDRPVPSNATSSEPLDLTWLDRFARCIRDVIDNGRDEVFDCDLLPLEYRPPGHESHQYLIVCPLEAGKSAPKGIARRVLELRLFTMDLFLVIAKQGLLSARQVLGSVRKVQDAREGLCYIAITLGRTLRLFSDAIGSEGIWSLPGLESVWASPSILWGCPHSRGVAKPYLSSVLTSYARNSKRRRRPAEPLQVDEPELLWKQWLSSLMRADVNLQYKLREYHSLVTIHRSDIANGRVFDALPEAGSKPGKKASTGRSRRLISGTVPQNNKRDSTLPITAEDIVPKGLNLKFAATILAHALEHLVDDYLQGAGKLPDALGRFPRIHLLLSGRDHLNGLDSSKFTIDQLNPIRESWLGVRFLRDTITSEDLLTSPTVFCNLLAAVGTGQNSRTEHFLTKVWMRKNAAGNLDLPVSGSELATRVLDVVNRNKVITLEYGNLGTYDCLTSQRSLQRLSAFHAVDDNQVWGGACAADIGFEVPIKRDRREKVDTVDKYQPAAVRSKCDSFFQASVQTTWLSCVDALKDGTENGTEKLWPEMLQVIIGLDVAPFKSDGLCAFQLTNHLAERGLCALPSLLDMADWISKHSNLGAYAGLKFLGFKVEPRNVALVLPALGYLDAHFKRSMSHQILHSCHYGMIFLENFLCKISRVDVYLAGLKATEELRQSLETCWDMNDDLAPFALEYEPSLMETVLRQQLGTP